MTRTHFIVLATAGSTALLMGAFLFQALGYAPCQMCIWQRWPHVVAVGIGLFAVIVSRHQRVLSVLGALAALTTGLIGIYHTGVERDWWDGPTSCSGGGALNTTDLLNTNIAPIVMCDDVVWSLFGLSMASYNALISFVLVSLWVAAFRK